MPSIRGLALLIIMLVRTAALRSTVSRFMLTSLKAASSVSAASFEELGGGVSEILELFAEQGRENETETQLVRLVSKSGYDEWKSSVPEEKQLTFKEVGIDLSKWPGDGEVFPNIDNSMFALYDDSIAPSKISFQSLWPAVMKTKKKQQSNGVVDCGAKLQKLAQGSGLATIPAEAVTIQSKLSEGHFGVVYRASLQRRQQGQGRVEQQEKGESKGSHGPMRCVRAFSFS